MSKLLKSYGLGLDLRTKEEGRQSHEKFYDGGEWQIFCEGGKKSPPGTRIVAELMLFIAKHFLDLLRLHQEQPQQAAAAARTSSASTSATGACSTSTASARAAGSRPKKSRIRGGVVSYNGGDGAAQPTDAAAAT
eukprot:6186654-Pleurochrysis_carterae.AAC.1